MEPGALQTCGSSRPFLQPSLSGRRPLASPCSNHQCSRRSFRLPGSLHGRQPWRRCGGIRLLAAAYQREVVRTELELEPLGEEFEEGRVSVFYHTSWDTPKLHGSIGGGEWQDHSFKRVSTAGGNLRVVHINTAVSRPANPEAPLLEFVIHNGEGQYDKSPDGENYSAAAPGSYWLEGGQLHEVKGEAIMLVSDLDDTMVGDDHAAQVFKAFWERDARLRGSVLVYNTGRALDKWLSLWREKSWCLAAPDVLISSVGTKVYHADPDTFQGWQLDQEFAKKLDDGWDLETVREAAYKALATVGRDSMHFRPPEEQNDHKITCGVRETVLHQVLDSIQLTLDRERVDAQLIVSGRGDWRFLDIVASRAGKLPALEYVRRRLGFSTKHTIVCGDSGNDKDMLSGSSRAVVVANAEPELKQLMQHQQVASEDGRIFMANKDMAAGILEGIAHFGFL